MTPSETLSMSTHRNAVAFAMEAVALAHHDMEAAFNTRNPDRIADATRACENATYAYDRALHQTRVLAERISDERWEADYGRASVGAAA